MTEPVQNKNEFDCYTRGALARFVDEFVCGMPLPFLSRERVNEILRMLDLDVRWKLAADRLDQIERKHKEIDRQIVSARISAKRRMGLVKKQRALNRQFNQTLNRMQRLNDEMMSVLPERSNRPVVFMGEVISDYQFPVFESSPRRPCSQCSDGTHHWLENSIDPSDSESVLQWLVDHPQITQDSPELTDGLLLAHYQCKHCPAIKPYDGEGGSDDAWLCKCGNFVDEGRCHCPDCLAEAPWGCDCHVADARREEEETVDFDDAEDFDNSETGND